MGSRFKAIYEQQGKAGVKAFVTDLNNNPKLPWGVKITVSALSLKTGGEDGGVEKVISIMAGIEPNKDLEQLGDKAEKSLVNAKG